MSVARDEELRRRSLLILWGAKTSCSDEIHSGWPLEHEFLREPAGGLFLAPFLIYDPDPYVVLGNDGRLSWIMDAFTISDSYPYSSHYRLNGNPVNYMRNSIKVVVDAYDGTTTFYVFDTEDRIIAACRRIFPSLFKDAAAMPLQVRKHVRYPELLLKLQAAVYGLYHMTDPAMFYNREDLWTVASEVGTGSSGEQTTVSMEPNFGGNRD